MIFNDVTLSIVEYELLGKPDLIMLVKGQLVMVYREKHPLAKSIIVKLMDTMWLIDPYIYAFDSIGAIADNDIWSIEVVFKKMVRP